MTWELSSVRVHVLVDDPPQRDRVVGELVVHGAMVTSCPTVELLRWLGSDVARFDVAVIDPAASGGAGLIAALALQSLLPPACPWVALIDRDDHFDGKRPA